MRSTSRLLLTSLMVACWLLSSQSLAFEINGFRSDTEEETKEFPLLAEVDLGLASKGILDYIKIVATQPGAIIESRPMDTLKWPSAMHPEQQRGYKLNCLSIESEYESRPQDMWIGKLERKIGHYFDSRLFS